MSNNRPNADKTRRNLALAEKRVLTQRASVAQGFSHPALQQEAEIVLAQMEQQLIEAREEADRSQLG